MARRKWAAKRITISLSGPEVEKLEHYCDATGRDATDVIRECVRKLRLPLKQEG